MNDLPESPSNPRTKKPFLVEFLPSEFAVSMSARELKLPNLSINDAGVVAAAIGKNIDQGSLPVNPALLELERALKVAKDGQVLLHEKMQTKILASIGGSYSFLEKSTLEKLQGQVAGLVDMRASLSGEALNTAMGVANTSYDRAQQEMSGILSSQDRIRSIGKADIPYRATGELGFRTDCSGVALERALGLGIPSDDRMQKELGGIQTSNEALRTNFLTDKTSSIQMPLRPEDTRLGRAMIESAKNSQFVALKMDALVGVIGGLNETFVTEVLPSLIKKVEHDQKGAKQASDQAASSLRWTQLAILASFVVTLLATWWQVSVAREIDRQSSEQQQKSLDILREQLASQQKFIEQQAGESEKLRKLISSISQFPAAKK